MPHLLLIVSQSDYLIQVIDTNSNTEWQTVQIHISWLLQKPTNLNLHCLLRQGIPGFSRTRVFKTPISGCGSYKHIYCLVFTSYNYFSRTISGSALHRSKQSSSSAVFSFVSVLITLKGHSFLSHPDLLTWQVP